MFGSVLALAALQISPRFESRAPLPALPAVRMDALGNSFGIANHWSRAFNLQARILWIDATANIDRYATEAKIVALVNQIADAGFNTVVFDVKPISGQVNYTSKLAPRLTEWRGKTLPANIEPPEIMVRECHRRNLKVYASLNAFSEGHSLFKVGPGYQMPDRQTVVMTGQNVLRAPDGMSAPVADAANTFPEDRLGVARSAANLPADRAAFVVSLRGDGRTADGFEWQPGGPLPSLPKGGVFVVGAGAMASQLRSMLVPGQRWEFTVNPQFVPISAIAKPQYPLMMNPWDQRNVDYALDIAREVVTKFPFDGIIYDDRLRFSGIDGDFSDQAKAAFEKSVGKRLTWPDDVFRFTCTPDLQRGIAPGPYYDRWLAFRAGRMKWFLNQVRGVIGSRQLGVYAGSWYGEYPANGANWAANDVRSGFWFADRAYRESGFAQDIDFLITGCYYPTPTIYEAMGQSRNPGASIEAAGMLSNRMVQDQTWTYAGIALSDFEGDPERLGRALQAALGSTQGVMVFDLSHNIDAMWPTFARAFSTPAAAPQADRDRVEKLRNQAANLAKNGRSLPPPIIIAGSVGTGQ